MKIIKEIHLKVKELKTDFQNPKRIDKKQLEALKKSLIQNGDFGAFLINENKQVLSGNQRVKALIELGKEESEVLCKMLCGYTLEEQKRILLESNEIRGKYILDELDEFIKGTNIDLSEFNIASNFARQEINALMEAEIPEVKVIPLVIAADEPDYDAFQDFMREKGFKRPIQAFKWIVKKIGGNKNDRE